jgi:hypothetical protein
MNQILSPIKNLIYTIRDRKVMLDHDLAILYGVETRSLKQAVKRNLERFPADFMFQLTEIEEEILRSQIVISSETWGGKRYPSLAFTELGIAMLSSVLKSEEAIKTNIKIMRTFFELRTILDENSGLNKRVEKIELESSALFKLVFHRLEILEKNTPLFPPKRRKIGFKF